MSKVPPPEAFGDPKPTPLEELVALVEGVRSVQRLMRKRGTIKSWDLSEEAGQRLDRWLDKRKVRQQEMF